MAVIEYRRMSKMIRNEVEVKAVLFYQVLVVVQQGTSLDSKNKDANLCLHITALKIV